MAARSVTQTGADPEVLGQINRCVDAVVALCKTDEEIRNFALKFQLEQAVDKAAYEAEGGNRLGHMEKALQRMADLALAVAKTVLRRTTLDFGEQPPRSGSVGKSSSYLQSPTSPDMFQCSSVADMAAGTEAWLESGARLSFESVQLLSLVLLAHPRLRPALQVHMLEREMVAYLDEALAVPKEHEYGYFQEGHKTEHMRLIANLVFENAKAAREIVHRNRLMQEILKGTKVDEDNPGLIEWAEFTIRNLCETNQEARDKIKNLTPIGLAKESEEQLRGKVDCSFTEDGKVKLSTVATAKKPEPK